LNFGTGIGVIGRDVSGSEALRRHASFRADIANGNFRAVANTLNTANIGVTVPAGAICSRRDFDRLCNGSDQIQMREKGGFHKAHSQKSIEPIRPDW
jgi:hypothetical protein